MIVLLDETQKLPVKRITKYGKRELAHRAFRAALSSDERMRVRNTKIISKKSFTLHNYCQNSSAV